MEDGHPMIAEVHQEEICRSTYVIVPQTEEAERMIGMMNKNLPAFLYHMLLEIDFTEEIIKKLIKNSCDTSLVAQIPLCLCVWNSNLRSLTTPEEERKVKAVKPLETAAWFRDEFGLLKKGPKSRIPLPIEEQFNLDSSSSIKTIHDRHQPPPASILKKPTTNNITSTNDAVDLSKDDDSNSNRDSASQTSSSSDEGDDDGSGDEGSRSKASDDDDEVMSATDGG
jgi:hypothetical protein